MFGRRFESAHLHFYTDDYQLVTKFTFKFTLTLRYSPVRYYDIRLIWIYLCLLGFYVGLNYIVSITLNTSVLADWIEVRPGTWTLSTEIKNLSSLRWSLFFFELHFSCVIAALFCGGQEETEGNYVGVWVCFLMGLPAIVNFVSNLWIWIIYSLTMIISGWILGKKTGFALPISKEHIIGSFREEIYNLVVPSSKLGRLQFRGNSAIIIIVAALVIPLGFALYYYFSAF